MLKNTQKYGAGSKGKVYSFLISKGFYLKIPPVRCIQRCRNPHNQLEDKCINPPKNDFRIQ